MTPRRRLPHDIVNWISTAVILVLSFSETVLATACDAASPWMANTTRFVVRAGMLLLPLAFLYVWTDTRPGDVFVCASGGRWHPTWKELVWGVSTGVALGSVSIAVFLYSRHSIKEYSGLLRRSYASWGIQTGFTFLVFAIGVSILHATYEEVVWRWIAFQHVVCRQDDVCRSAIGRAARTTSSSSFWRVSVIAIITSIFFSAFHLVMVSSYLSPHVLPMVAIGAVVFMAGITWCAVTYATGTLWSAIVSHIMVDAVMFGCEYTALFAA